MSSHRNTYLRMAKNVKVSIPEFTVVDRYPASKSIQGHSVWNMCRVIKRMEPMAREWLEHDRHEVVDTA